jgi:DNA-binding NarL/FixJ family response regulator
MRAKDDDGFIDCSAQTQFIQNKMKGGTQMSEPRRIRILSVDDHALVREGIATVINDQPDMQVVADAANGGQGISQFRQYRPDVTLLDLRLPDMSGIEALTAVRREFPEARIIMLTTFDGDVEVQRALEAGARGYLLKSMAPESMFQVIRQVHNGKAHVSAEIAMHLAEHLSDERLTRREIDVLQQIAEGNRNSDIAAKLFVAEGTVKVHVKNIMQKLGATDRTHAVTIAVRRGIIQL